jgi:hypothetical protein
MHTYREMRTALGVLSAARRIDRPGDIQASDASSRRHGNAGAMIAHRRTRRLTSAVAVAASLGFLAPPASAAELVTNGGFESGTFSGWTTTQPSSPLQPWTIATSSTTGWFTLASPPEGTHDALNGFDGVPGHFTLTQTISIPAATATLTWKDRLQYVMYAGAQERLLEVKVLDAGTDAVLATPYTFTTGPGDFTMHDTGWQAHSVDLSAFGGQTVKLRFDETIPEEFTGPAQAELDAISVQTTPLWVFSGFFQPIDNGRVLNATKAGGAVPVKFSLGGDQGLDILAAGSPSSQPIACDSSAPVDVVEQTSTAGSSSLSYDASSDRYTYIWKTEKAWAGSCRQLTVELTDGSTHTANFKFTK